MENVIDILKKVGAIITDSHFVGTSGRHMPTYINKDALFPYPEEASKVGLLFAQKYQDVDIDVVVAPAMGGVILSHVVAYHLSLLKKKVIHGVYTEKTSDGDQIFKRGFDHFVKGKKVLVIEDLTTTGGSVKKVVDQVRAVGGEVVEVCVMVNRDKELANSESIGAPFSWLAYFAVESYPEEDCPLCEKGVPINTTVGHGKEFLAKRELS
jgi:orotate phosphoribosyltransferase